MPKSKEVEYVDAQVGAEKTSKRRKKSRGYDQLDEAKAPMPTVYLGTRVEKSMDELVEPIVLDKHKRRKSKKRKEDVDGGDRKKSQSNTGKRSDRLGDDDDMLFNFDTQSEVVASPQSRQNLAAAHRKGDGSVTVWAEDAKAALISKHESEMVDADNKSFKSNNDQMKRKKKRRKLDEREGSVYVAQTETDSHLQRNTLQCEAASNEQQLRESNQSGRPPTTNVRHSILPGRPTFSMAVAGSIVDNAQSLELATMLAGQIARAAAIFRLDEIVVFDDYDGTQTNMSEEVGGLFMVKILEYLEVPQYLRKALIPKHQSLNSVGKLPPLDAPHHLRKHEWGPFREGVVVDRGCSSSAGSYVDVGLDRDVLVEQSLKPGRRVTVAMGQSKANGNVLQVVDRETARRAGFYWGYTVRYANCFSAVLEECPFEEKYDFCIGTSEHGEKLRVTELVIPKCKHVLVAFGGLSGLEESFELDKKLKNRPPAGLFDLYVNTCPNQGSRTIRTEEAILISLQFLQPAVQNALGTL